MPVKKGVTAEDYKKMSIGVEDEYGNPFRLIQLRWNRNSIHKMADYGKTRGFEDAVIRMVRGDIVIKYRAQGSVMWMRPNGGFGPFMGEVPQTPKNMERLASCYGDKLFTIVDKDIEMVVAKMYEAKVENMTTKEKAANEKRIQQMHSVHIENTKDGEPTGDVPSDVDKVSITDQNRINRIKEQELSQKEIELDRKEKELNDRLAKSAGAGYAASTYSKEYLSGMKLFEVRRLMKEFGLKFSDKNTKEELIAMITDKQDNKPAPVVAESLDS
jgi:hypothetical protein